MNKLFLLSLLMVVPSISASQFLRSINASDYTGGPITITFAPSFFTSGHPDLIQAVPSLTIIGGPTWPKEPKAVEFDLKPFPKQQYDIVVRAGTNSLVQNFGALPPHNGDVQIVVNDRTIRFTEMPNNND